MVDRNVFLRWQDRLEKGLARLLEKGVSARQSGRYREALEHSRSLSKINAPLARLFNGLGEVSLRLGFALLALVLLRRAERIDKKDPLLKINLSRAQLSLANRFLLRAPGSGAAAFNLGDGRKRLDQLLANSTLPESRRVEATLLLRRIEDRLEMWNDYRLGELERSGIKEILLDEDKEFRQLKTTRIASVEEIEKLAPRRTGFYYRDYREQQRKKGGRRGRG
ncbi:MAG TPA: hypothetical protein VJ417_13075 [Candidatus Glassbacteria bacterium]|nr:hypothetical protein [Candidatus Glassbacteria bacterium]